MELHCIGQFIDPGPYGPIRVTPLEFTTKTRDSSFNLAETMRGMYDQSCGQPFSVMVGRLVYFMRRKEK